MMKPGGIMVVGAWLGPLAYTIMVAHAMMNPERIMVVAPG
jgi:hypothetical protein